MTIPRVTKFSTHEIFDQRIFSRLLRIGLRESRNLKPRKFILKSHDSFSRKFEPPKITRYTVCHYSMHRYIFCVVYRNYFCYILKLGLNQFAQNLVLVKPLKAHKLNTLTVFICKTLFTSVFLISNILIILSYTKSKVTLYLTSFNIFRQQSFTCMI